MSTTAAHRVSTHVLDAERGGGVAGVGVRLSRLGGDGDRREVVAEQVTDAGGRACLVDGPLPGGRYELRFDLNRLGRPGAERGRGAYLEEVSAVVRLDGGDHHVPLLVAGAATTLYRGGT